MSANIAAGAVFVEVALDADRLDEAFAQVRKKSLAQGGAAGDEFQREYAKAGAKLATSLANEGAGAGKKLAKLLQTEYQSELSKAKQMRFDNLIDDKELAARGRRAAQGFNAALMSGLKELRGKNIIPEQEFDTVARSLKAAGMRSGHALGEGMTQGTKESAEGLLTWVKGIFVVQLAQFLSAALGKLRAFAQGSVDAFRASQESLARLNAMVVANGGAVQRTGDQLVAFSKRLRRETLFQADEIERSMAQLLTYHSITGKTFERTLRLATDLSSVFGGLSQSTEAVARALDDPIAGLAMLSKQGFKFDDSVKAQIKSLAEQNRLFEAQDIILRDLEGQVGGVAKRMKRDMGDSVDDMGKTWLTFKERAGRALSELFSGPITTVTKAIAALADGMLSPLDRAIERMQRLGMAAEHTAVQIAKASIKELRAEKRQLDDGVVDARGNRMLNRRENLRLPGTGGDGRRLGDLGVEELRAKRAEIVRLANAAPDESQRNGWLKLAEAIDVVLEKERDRIDNTRELSEAERTLEQARKDSDIQAEIDANDERIRRIDEEIEKTGALTAAQESQRAALVAANAELEKQKSGYRAPEKPGPHIETDEEKKKREQLAKDRKAFFDDLRGQLAQLTASAEDDLALQLDRMEQQIRTLYGEKWPAEVRAGFEKIRKAQQETLQLNAIEERVDGLSNIENPTTRAEAYEREIEALDILAASLEEGSAVRKRAIEMIARYSKALQQARKDEQDAAKAVVDAEKKKADERKKAEDEQKRAAKEQLLQLRDRARSLEENARAALQVAEAIGLIGEGASRSLQSVAQLGAAVYRIAGGDLSAIPVAIGAVASLIKGANSSRRDEEQRRALEAHRATLERNRDALEKLRTSLDALSNTFLRSEGGPLGKAQNALGSVFGDFHAREQEIAAEYQARRSAAGEEYGSSADTLRRIDDEERQAMARLREHTAAAAKRALSDAGITQDELARLAEQYSITLDGSYESVLALFGAIKDANIESVLSSFTGRMGLLRTEFELLNVTDPVEKLQRMRAVLADFVSGDLQQRLAGLDLSTSEGRAGLEALIQEVFAQVKGDSFDITQLGTLSIQQLLEAFGSLKELAEGGGIIGEGAQTRLSVGITEMQANVLLTYQASQLYHLAGIHALLGGQPMPTITPPSAASLGLAPVTSGGGGSTVLQFGDLHVDVDLRGVQTTDAAEMGRMAGQGFGDGFADRLAARYRAAGQQRPRFLTDQDRR